ncbi:MAG: tetratricopeptide repeat protein [Chloroflexota bacterium]
MDNQMVQPCLILALALIASSILTWNKRRQQLERNRARSQANASVKLNIFPTSLPENPYQAEVIKNTFKLERYPNNPTFYCDRGAAYLMLQKFDDALHDFNRAVDLKPDYADAYSNRGLVHYTQGRFEEAASDYGRAIEILATDGVYYLNRAQAYRRLGKYEHALADLQHTSDLQPNSPDARKERGLVYYAMGDKAQALVDLQEYRTMVGYFMTDAEAIKALMDLESKE